MVKRRTVVGTAIVGGVGLALAYLFYGKDGIPEIIPKTTTTRPGTTTSPRTVTTTTPVATTTSVTPIPTTITPPTKPENMLTPYLGFFVISLKEVIVEGVSREVVHTVVANLGTAPSFATNVEMYTYTPERGYELYERKLITIQPGQGKEVDFGPLPEDLRKEITKKETAVNLRLMDPILDPLREPIEERSRKVGWFWLLPSEFPPS